MRWALVMIVAVAVAAPAAAEEPSVRELRRVVVRVADEGNTPAGDEVEGRLIELGPETLVLLVDGRRVDVPLVRVIRIRTARDPLWNGAVIGGLIGGVWCALVCGQGLPGAGHYVPAVVLGAGFWAGVGVGIDAANTGQVTIYERPSAAPGAGRPRAALSVGFRF